ncbi:MAG: hypothetical protein QXT43_02685 [Candidatus Micrarchaeaceae archaeon]
MKAQISLSMLIGMALAMFLLAIVLALTSKIVASAAQHARALAALYIM